jgi:hypothetical protein
LRFGATSATPDIEVYRAVLPALATTKGLLIGVSSPYRRNGLLHEKHRDNFGVDNDDVLVVQGPTQLFNPLLDTDEIAAQKALDPAGAASEWDAQFRSDVCCFLDDAVIEQCIDYDRPLELPPRSGVFYRAFVDAAGGTGSDAYSIGVAHREKGGRIVVDLVRGTRGRFDPYAVTESYSTLLREYRVRTVRGDRYGAEWVGKVWSKAGVRYIPSELAKSQIYLECIPAFTRGLVSLPNHPTWLRELRLLERHTHRSGKDTVDPPRSGHDDYANSCCGALDAVVRGLGLDYSSWMPNREADPAVARSIQAVQANERVWGRYKRGAGVPADIRQMYAEHDAAVAAAAANPQPSLEQALREFARESSHAP